MPDHVRGTDIAEICTCFPYLYVLANVANGYGHAEQSHLMEDVHT